MLDVKMFRVLKQDNNLGKQYTSRSKLKSDDEQSNEMLSMRQLINNGPEFVKNQIFTTRYLQQQHEDGSGASYQYVHILMNKVKTADNTT